MRSRVLLASWLAACSQRVAPSDELPDVVAEEDAPVVLAKAECTPELECECEAPRYADVDACIEERAADYEAAALAAMDAGLTYDGECVAAIVAWHADVGCALQSSFVFPEP